VCGTTVVPPKRNCPACGGRPPPRRVRGALFLAALSIGCVALGFLLARWAPLSPEKVVALRENWMVVALKGLLGNGSR